MNGSVSGDPGLGSKVLKDLIPESTGPLEIPGLQGKAKPPRERALVNGDLAPPRPIVIGEVVIRAVAIRLADEMADWSGCCLAHDNGSSWWRSTRSRGQAERTPPTGAGRPSFSPFGPHIVPAGTGTLSSPRQVAGFLRLSAAEPL